MEAIRAALGYQFNLATTAPAFGCAGVSCDGSEFLDRIDGRVADGGKCLSSSLVVGIDSVDRDVSLVSSRTSNRPYAICSACADIVPDYSGAQTKECRRRIAKLDRKIGHSTLINDVCDTGVDRVQRRFARTRNCHRVIDSSDRQFHIMSLSRSDSEGYICDYVGLKTRRRDSY